MERIIVDEIEFGKILGTLAGQILSRHPDSENLTLIGIKRRGADIAARLAPLLGKGADETGSLDINLYRDDWGRLAGAPHIGDSNVPLLDGKIVALVDDVLFSGRTIRAALEAILDYGRPAKVELLVMVDRGHRELPICADYVGKLIETAKDQQIDVLLKERDGRDAIVLR